MIVASFAQVRTISIDTKPSATGVAARERRIYGR
jgi:hypothetical protein